MKKFILVIMFFLLLSMTGCTDPSVDYISFELKPGIDTVELQEDYIDPGATAYYGFKKLEVITVINEVDTSRVGVYDIVYQVTYKDLTQTWVRKVTVVDETPPTITLNPGIDTILIGDTWVDAGVTVSDQSQLDVTVTITGQVVPAVGRYEITYQATDYYGNTSDCVRIVYVIDPQ